MLRVLVIDDDPFVLRMIDRMLDGLDCIVTSAGNGSEGIERYRQGSHDLVIADVAIPVSEGLETIRTLRRLARSLPILAMSGGGWLLGGSDLLDLARCAGANETLAKPFTTEQLRSAVSCCILAA